MDQGAEIPIDLGCIRWVGFKTIGYRRNPAAIAESRLDRHHGVQAVAAIAARVGAGDQKSRAEEFDLARS